MVVKGDEAPIVLSAMNRRDAPIGQPARGCQSNVSGFDYLLQLMPTGRVQFYRPAA